MKFSTPRTALIPAFHTSIRTGEQPSLPDNPSKQAKPDSKRGPLRKILALLGPGLITGASDDDPSGIATYMSAGAAFGYQTLWTAPLTFPLMLAVQYTCAKIGMVTGTGLAGVLREHYSRWVLWPALAALVIANTINAGADIGAIAAALNLFVPIQVTLLVVPVTILILAFQILGSYRLLTRIFKWLALALLAYIGAAILARPDWGAVLKASLAPSWNPQPQYLMTLVAILGTTISPYLFFWQSNQAVEEEVEMGRSRRWQRVGAEPSELKMAFWDVAIGMFFCNLVFYFVIVASGATLHRAGQTSIETAAQAASALEPLAGPWAKALFGVGLIGAGLLAVPVLTGSSAYAVSEALGRPYGLSEKPARAPLFYALIVLGTLAGLSLNYLGVSPIRALLLTAVLNGLLSPPLLVLILCVANNPKIMGREHTNGPLLNLCAGLATLAMLAAAAALVLS